MVLYKSVADTILLIVLVIAIELLIIAGILLLEAWAAVMLVKAILAGTYWLAYQYSFLVLFILFVCRVIQKADNRSRSKRPYSK